MYNTLKRSPRQFRYFGTLKVLSKFSSQQSKKDQIVLTKKNISSNLVKTNLNKLGYTTFGYMLAPTVTIETFTFLVILQLWGEYFIGMSRL